MSPLSDDLIIWFLIFCAGAYLSFTFLPEPWKRLCGAVFGIGALFLAIKALLTIV